MKLLLHLHLLLVVLQASEPAIQLQPPDRRAAPRSSSSSIVNSRSSSSSSANLRSRRPVSPTAAHNLRRSRAPAETYQESLFLTLLLFLLLRDVRGDNEIPFRRRSTRPEGLTSRTIRICPPARIQWAKQFWQKPFLIFLVPSTETQETSTSLFFLLLLQTPLQPVTMCKGAPIPHQPKPTRKGAQENARYCPFPTLKREISLIVVGGQMCLP